MTRRPARRSWRISLARIIRRAIATRPGLIGNAAAREPGAGSTVGLCGLWRGRGPFWGFLPRLGPLRSHGGGPFLFAPAVRAPFPVAATGRRPTAAAARRPRNQARGGRLGKQARGGKFWSNKMAKEKPWLAN